jgi:hypothetical protein
MFETAAETLALIEPGATLVAPADTSARALRASLFKEFAQELNPVGFSETLLIRELAWRGAQMIKEERLFEAIESQAGPALSTLALPAGDHQGDGQSLSASLCAHERLESFSRRSRQNSEAFIRLLRQVNEIHRDRVDAGLTLNQKDPRFATEAQCLAYLVRRFRAGQQVCRQCNQAGSGSWIAARRCFQCASCKTQTCVRHGTVFARSGLPLAQWFHAVAIALNSPLVGTRDAATAIGIRRLPTVRTMLKKIRAAMLADDATALLAGLDQVYLPGY